MTGKSLLLLAATACALSGCASNFVALDVPKEPGPLGPLPTTKTITQRIRCELAQLASPGLHNNLADPDYVVAVQLSLQVQDDGSLAPAETFTNGVFSFAAGAKFDYQRTSTFNADLIYDMKEIQTEISSEMRANQGELPATSYYACPPTSETNLDGDLGINTAGLMGRYTQDTNSGDASGAKAGEFGGSVQFIVTKNLNAVGPTWTLKHWKGPGALAGVSEVNTDSVTFAFVRRTPIPLYAAAAAKPGLKAKAKETVEVGNASVRARNYIDSIQINILGSTLGKIEVNTK